METDLDMRSLRMSSDRFCRVWPIKSTAALNAFVCTVNILNIGTCMSEQTV